MRIEHKVAEAAGVDLPDNRPARIQRDAARVSELAAAGFKGPAYDAFEDELLRKSWPILLGMLRGGQLPRIAMKRCKSIGRPFWVHADDMALWRSSSEARDEILIDVLNRARVSFKRKALVGGGWNPDHKQGRGACSLTTYFVGQCIWEFRRVYTTWAKDRVEWARLHALYDGSEEAARQRSELFGPLLATDYVSEPEASVLSTNFEDILNEQPAITRAVIRLTVEGYVDTEIAEMLCLTHAAVRMRKTRFRNVLYDAARERRIWIPEQLHTKGGLRHRGQRGAA